MGRSSRRDVAVRACVGVLVVAMHLAVLTVRWDRPVPKGTHSSALLLVSIDEPTRDLPAVEPPIVTSEPSPPRLLPDPSITNVRPADEAPTLPDPAPAVDWRASMEAAAAAAAGKIAANERYRPLAPVERDEEDSSAPTSIFEKPRRKLGDVDHDATQGRTLVWNSEHCYTELHFPTIKDPNVLQGLPNPCKFVYPTGKREPRGDLFDGMKAR